MNIYAQKQAWKVILFVTALIIVGASFWYTNTLVKHIAAEERTQVKLWAEAIQKKAKLVQYTNELFKELSVEERKKVELWAEATKQLATASDISDYTFIFKAVANNTTVPVILADEQGKVISHRNLDSEKAKDPNYLKQTMQEMAALRNPLEFTIYGTEKRYLYYKDSRLFSELRQVLDDLIKSFISEVVVNSASVPVIFTDKSQTKVLDFGNIDSTKLKDNAYLTALIAEMRSENEPIEIHLSDDTTNYIFYQDSTLLTRLKYYPIIQFIFIGLFILIAYWLFSMARKAEQNQVWAGMAKETAHQLGTPLSSLMAWMELFKAQGLDKDTINEVNKDLNRLETIADRFSKIGSAPTLEKENINLVMDNAINYMKVRSSKKIIFNMPVPNTETAANINIPLFEWVIENLIRNAIDAMNGAGEITISITDQIQQVYIDITDTGKGIPYSKQKSVFQPGFTTKKRGWGLGLSLTKRIIEEYHNGKIFIKKSEVNKGTTFRIVLNK